MRPLAIILFLFAFTSINGQVELSPTDIKVQKEPNIKICQQAPDTVRLDLNSISKKDTVIITGYIANCGEWGGHFEHIIITRRKKSLICWFKRDPDNCVYTLPVNPKQYKQDSLNFNEKTREPNNDTVLISGINKKLIKKYFTKFGILAMTCKVFSNAPTEYIIAKNNKTLYHRKDPSGAWAGFTDLRDKLFLK
jgi:hypothetical protein